ncbi:histidine kinase CKI1-like [Prosopis cineraria]|uniref:histidine kinase CKI1-like n=1 Tax=Prosopis cineraria TaxID=364024 RepID=UPI00240ECC1B|nr:histidine kinase CKI1-like [Prosopis cineraria]
MQAFAGLVALLLSTPCWYVMLKRIEQRVTSNSENLLSELQAQLHHSTKLKRPLNSSSTNLARLLDSTFNETNVSFSFIETKVAPMLFQAFQTIPHLTEISYIDMEGFFFSYYIDQGQTLALYSNSSFSSPAGASKIMYVQPVNPSTGDFYGEARIYEHPVDASWIQEAINSSYGYASLGYEWSNNHQILFVNSVRISRTAVISLGFAATLIVDFVTPVERQGASLLYLASKDGKVILRGFQRAHMVFSNDTASLYLVKSNNGDRMSYQGTVSCKDEASASVLKIGATKYLASCSSIDAMGVELVYVIAVPQNGLVAFVHKSKKLGLVLMSAMMVTIFISISSFLLLKAMVGWREMHLCSSLIKQMEATQQAERKSMNKSLAFSRASHDIRASLAGLTGLLEMSYEEVVPDSELETNLKQMGACIKDLQGLLNSILDTSKIESGKMQLEEHEFDLSQFIEDKVDLFHPLALKKGVDLVLDHCDGSIIKYAHVKGDEGKLQQVLCNLLSNAVKFTDEGHITVRVWAQKPSFQNSIISSHRYNFLKRLSCLFCKKNEANIDVEAVNTIQQDPQYLEFVFEVDDTGKGIPKEKQTSVFENYVQVNETAFGLEGTGLGLGIVQSLVHLMHGDIRIVDKEIGEKGTCFRFSVLLALSETVTGSSSTREGNDLNQPQRQDINGLSSGSSIRSPSPRLPIFASNRSGASCVVLLIQNEERQRTTQRFIEGLGIKVKVVKQWEHLSHTLKKIKQRGCNSSQSSTGTSYMSSQSTPHNSNSRAKGFPLSAADGIDYMSSIFKKSEDEVSLGLVLLVIDVLAGPFAELCIMISEFRSGLGNPCKVVWLNKSLICLIQMTLCCPKPFHGTRLFNIIKLLPELGGNYTCISRTARARRDIFHETMRKTFKDYNVSRHQSPVFDRSEVPSIDAPPFLDVELQKCDSSWRTEQLDSYGRSKGRNSQVDHGEIQECSASGSDKPLSGMKFLVVDDTEILRRIALKTLEQLGATSVECKNGGDAVNLVEEGLRVAFPHPPYDYIIMDCEMPVMDGFEATMRIRKVERNYGVYIPIMALTAHTSRKETNKIKEAGMDAHLSKPLKKEHLLDAIKSMDNK